MPFTVNTITLKGAELLASATAANPLILDGCDATQTYIDQATAVNVSARPASPYSNTTSVSIIGATSNHVVARAQFEAGTNTGGDVNTIYLYGHSQNDPSNVYVVYVCSSQTAVHLPLTTDVLTIVEILCDMIYTVTSGSVQVASTSVFTTLAEFNLLKNRTVTTHKEGEATTGEAQFIYGSKTFVNDLNCPATGHFTSLIADSGITTSGDIDCNDIDCDDIIASSVKTVSLQAKTGSQIAIDTNLVPDNDLSCNLGDSTHRYSTVYTSNIDCNGGTVNVKGSVVVGASSNPCLIYPTSTATDSSIGTYTYPFKKAYLGTAMVRDESSGSSKETWVGIPKTQTEDGVTTVVKSNSSISFFESNSEARTTICSYYDDDEGDDAMYTYIELKHDKGGVGHYDSLEIYVDDYEDYKLSIYKPAADKPWLCDIEPTIYANNGILGTTPSYDAAATTITVPIGGIVAVWFPSTGSETGTQSYAGEQITIPASTYKVANSYNGNIGQGNKYIPAGDYVFLMEAVRDSVSSWALLQRVA